LLKFSERYAEMITRVSLVRRGERCVVGSLALGTEVDDLCVRLHGWRCGTLRSGCRCGRSTQVVPPSSFRLARGHFFLSASRRIIWNRVGAPSEVVTAAALRTNRVSVAWSSMLAARPARLVKMPGA
jgi:hypothetical protein